MNSAASSHLCIGKNWNPSKNMAGQFLSRMLMRHLRLPKKTGVRPSRDPMLAKWSLKNTPKRRHTPCVPCGIPLKLDPLQAGFHWGTMNFMTNACHLLPVVAPDPDIRWHCAEAMKSAGIQTSLHYPFIPVILRF